MKIAKYLVTEITGDGIAWRRDEPKIGEEAALDGSYVSFPAIGQRVAPEPSFRSMSRRKSWISESRSSAT
jgi:hypothetical protein